MRAFQSSDRCCGGISVAEKGAQNFVYQNVFAIGALLAAMVLFLASAILAILVQAYGYEYSVISDDALKALARDHQEWGRRADDATRAGVAKQVSTICTMRGGNSTKATLIQWSLWLLVCGIVFLSISASVELFGRQ